MALGLAAQREALLDALAQEAFSMKWSSLTMGQKNSILEALAALFSWRGKRPGEVLTMPVTPPGAPLGALPAVSATHFVHIYRPPMVTSFMFAETERVCTTTLALTGGGGPAAKTEVAITAAVVLASGSYP